MHWRSQYSNSPAGLPPAGHMLQVVHLQHIVVHHLFHRWCTTCGLFLFMHHKEVVVHKLQVYHLQIVVHEVYHLMHHLLCSAGHRPANENDGILHWCTTSGCGLACDMLLITSCVLQPSVAKQKKGYCVLCVGLWNQITNLEEGCVVSQHKLTCSTYYKRRVS